MAYDENENVSNIRDDGLDKKYESAPIYDGAPNKHPLVLFSGGMDSTFLLSYMLVRSNVYTLYVNCGQGEDKVLLEKKARKSIFKEVKKSHRMKVLDDFEVDFFKDTASYSCSNFGRFKQMVPWLVSALYVIKPAEVSEVLIAYVTDDQAALFVSEMKAAWAALWAITHSEPLVPLRFPLIEEMQNKNHILDGLSNDLITKTWVCETPVKKKKIFKSCGYCPACLRLIAALAYYEAANHRVYPCDLSRISNGKSLQEKDIDFLMESKHSSSEPLLK